MSLAEAAMSQLQRTGYSNTTNKTESETLVNKYIHYTYMYHTVIYICYIYIYMYNTGRCAEGKSDSHSQHFSHKSCLLSAMFCISKSRGFSPVNHFTLVLVKVAWTSPRKMDVTHRGNSARVDGIPWNMLITSCQLWPRLTSLFCWSEQP